MTTKTNKKTQKTSTKTSSKTPAVGALVMQFFTKRGEGKEFRTSQLRDFVSKKVETAPGTIDRTMRQLRQQGKVNYTVTDRREGRYQITSV